MDKPTPTLSSVSEPPTIEIHIATEARLILLQLLEKMTIRSSDDAMKARIFFGWISGGETIRRLMEQIDSGAPLAPMPMSLAPQDSSFLRELIAAGMASGMLTARQAWALLDVESALSVL